MKQTTRNKIYTSVFRSVVLQVGGSNTISLQDMSDVNVKVRWAVIENGCDTMIARRLAELQLSFEISRQVQDHFSNPKLPK